MLSHTVSPLSVVCGGRVVYTRFPVLTSLTKLDSQVVTLLLCVFICMFSLGTAQRTWRSEGTSGACSPFDFLSCPPLAVLGSQMSACTCLLGIQIQVFTQDSRHFPSSHLHSTPDLLFGVLIWVCVELEVLLVFLLGHLEGEAGVR